jgi:hypothetical protein
MALGDTEKTPGPEKTSPDVETSSTEIVPPEMVAGQSRGNEDPLEAALAKAIEGAAAAGRFDVVAQIAKELEARRLATMGNVVKLDRKRRGSP